MAKMSGLALLRSRGFDGSKHIPGTKRYRIKCSQCQAMTINGIPVHERGCPNDRRSRGEDSGDTRRRSRHESIDGLPQDESYYGQPRSDRPDKRYAIWITGTWMPILIYAPSLKAARRRAQGYAHTSAYPGSVKRVELAK